VNLAGCSSLLRCLLQTSSGLLRDAGGFAEPAVEGELLGEREDLAADAGEGGGVGTVLEGIGDPATDDGISASFMPRVVRRACRCGCRKV